MTYMVHPVVYPQSPLTAAAAPGRWRRRRGAGVAAKKRPGVPLESRTPPHTSFRQ